MAAFYAVVCLLVWALQYRLLYMPTRMTEAAALEQASGLNLVRWPAEGELRGYVAEPETESPRGTVVVMHGNAGDAVDRAFLVPLFRRQGFRVLLYEYTGYGPRGGRVGEPTMVPDAIEGILLAREQWGAPIHLVGESLGAGVAAAVVAGAGDAIDGVALFTPWATLRDLAASRFWFLPARWMVRDRYDSIGNLAGYAGPVAVIIALQDEVIPVSHSRRLYESLSPERRLLVEMPGAGHNTWPMTFGHGEAARIVEFLARDAAPRPY
jgi:alpha-beta hydrolase superfamily lysophospholipase